MLVRELKSTGAKLEESDIVCHLLLTMPEEYDMVVTALETNSSEQLTLTFVKTRLLDEVAKRSGGLINATANATRTEIKTVIFTKIETRTLIGRRKNFVFLANRSESDSSDVSWSLDSGSTEHLSTKETKLTNVRKLMTPINIRVAKSGQVLTADEIGDLRVRTQVNGKTSNIVVTEILSVSGLEYNLLSVRKLEINGF